MNKIHRNDNGDWQEDFQHENGQYWCICRVCEELFIGHKRRRICRKCANKVENTITLKKE